MTEIQKQKKMIGLILFLFSGMISLIFQVSWLKMLLPVFGNTVWAASTLLTAFMAGLAIGSWIFGRIADRIGSPLKLYGILEGFIGLYGLLTLLIFSKLHLLYVPLYRISGGDTVLMGFIKFFMDLIILLPPTICMGATLPLLARQFTADVNRSGSSIGTLYMINTLGAVLGTFFSGFYLIPYLGLRTTVFIAVAVNLVIMGLILLLCKGESIRFKLQGLFRKTREIQGRRWVLYVYFICGFTGLAYEVIWNRILTLHLGSSVYAYSIMLVVYLLGITLGAGLMSYFVSRIKQPVALFAIIQGLLALDLILMVNQFEHLPEMINTFLGMMVGEGFASYVLALFISTLQLLILPTILFGASFPLAVRLYVQRKDELGEEVGVLYAVNTFGTILGAFFAGFLILPLVGAQRGMLLLGSMNLMVAIYLALKSRWKITVKWLAIGLSLVLFFGGYHFLTRKNQVLLSAQIFSDSEDSKVKLLTCDEDIYATVAVEERQSVRGTWKQLSLNGMNVAGTSSELFTIQKLQGHLPLMMHPTPKSVLHIGFGSGGTAWAVSRYPVDRITIAEISRSVIEKASKYFHEINHGVLEDPRVKVVYTDGRNRVLADPETYDVILSDSIHPRFSGNGSLYTYDYYQLLKRRLNPGGVVSQWLPFYGITPKNFKMILNSFYQVFPNTTVWFVNNTINSYVIVIGKLGSAKVDYAVMADKLAIPSVKSDLAEIECDSTYKLLDFLFFANETVGEFIGDTPLHTDDNMAVEYLSSRAINRRLTSYLNYVALLKFRTAPERYLVNLDKMIEPRELILAELNRYWIATTYNLKGQQLYREGKGKAAFRVFDRIPALNPDDKEPVEYFGASFQAPFLRKTFK